MLAGPLKKRFIWSQLSDQNAGFEGYFLPESSERISKVFSEMLRDLSSTEVPIRVRLQFGVDRKQRARVQGTCEWTMALTCARCDELIRLDLEAAFDLTIATSREALEQLNADEDGVIADGKWVALNDIIEDPVLLALPMSPKHDGCVIQSAGLNLEIGEAPKEEAAGSPEGETTRIGGGESSNTEIEFRRVASEDEENRGKKKPFANLRALMDGVSDN